MSATPDPIGSIGWIDLTVDDAESARDFYSDVVGWRPQSIDMGDYADFAMQSPTDDVARTGVCHRRGGNASVPEGWIVYFIVADLDRSLDACRKRGGKILVDPKGEGDRYAMIEDPTGAVCALYQKKTDG